MTWMASATTRGLPPDKGNTPRRLAERFRREVVAGDWSAVASMIADDFVREDHWPGHPVERSGRDRFVADVQALAGLGVDVEPPRVVAQRGAFHALARVTFQVPGADVVDRLVVVVCNVDHRVQQIALFPSTELAVAVWALDERFMEWLRPVQRAVVSANADLLWAAATGDTKAIGACLAPGFVIVDHRESEPGFMRRDEAISRIAAVNGPDAQQGVVDLFTKFHALGAAVLVVSRSLATPDTVDAVNNDLILTRVEQGVVAAMECFPGSQLEVAMQRAIELSEGAPMSVW